MKELINKIKEWFKKILNKSNLQLPEKTLTNVIEDDKILKNQFKNDLRIEPSDDERDLISDFENGKISLIDLTEEMRDKIINGYTLLINKNVNIMNINMKKIKSAK